MTNTKEQIKNGIEIVKQFVKDVNTNAQQDIIKIGSLPSQWEKGSISVKRSDNFIGTLSINVRMDDCRVGCDGKNYQDKKMNKYLENQGYRKISKEGVQNTRYQCEDYELEDIIDYYAHIGN